MHARPGPGKYFGDFIPFFWDGEYHIFYLERHGEGVETLSWGHIKSRDLLTWEPLPYVVHPGRQGEPDVEGCWTGSVIEHKGMFYCFYTGYSPRARYPQTICLAASADLEQWRKVEDNPILVPDERLYEANDWRDPYVFYNPYAGRFWMLIAARDKHAAGPRNGCVALATSDDLYNWEVQPPLWSGGVCHTPECPDMFTLAQRWYLIYSHGVTRYRFSDTPNGPWRAGIPDTLDATEVCAGKSLNDGKRQLLFGWIPTREGDTDNGKRQWGGHMALPRELVPQPDGSLWTRLPTEFHLTARDATLLDVAALLRLPDMPADYQLSLTMTLQGAAAEAGFLVRMNETGEQGRKIGIEPSRLRLAFYDWLPWGDAEPTVTRRLALTPGQPFTVHLVVHGSICEVFVADQASVATRLYAPAEGWLGLYVADGTMRCENLRIKELPKLT